MQQLRLPDTTSPSNLIQSQLPLPSETLNVLNLKEWLLKFPATSPLCCCLQARGPRLAGLRLAGTAVMDAAVTSRRHQNPADAEQPYQ